MEEQFEWEEQFEEGEYLEEGDAPEIERELELPEEQGEGLISSTGTRATISPEESTACVT